MSSTESFSFTLTALRLRFHCAVKTPIHFGGLRAGSNLRGALVNVMRRAACPEAPLLVGEAEEVRSAHLAVCPVCWLVAANDHPGQERRGYVITPPLAIGESLEPGAAFDFHLTLFGEALRYLPYFVLAVPEAGRTGLGAGRGRFALKSIHAEHPLYEDWIVLKQGENVVHPPADSITHADIQQAAEALAIRLGTSPARLRLDFLTPLRIILDERLLKSPDFGAIFNHILRRADELAVQYCGGVERPLAERQRLWELAKRVSMVESQTRWAEVSSGSNRTGQPTWISGLVGSACYSAPLEVWRELLTWLLWGEIVQVGKDTTKGNGVYRLNVD